MAHFDKAYWPHPEQAVFQAERKISLAPPLLFTQDFSVVRMRGFGTTSLGLSFKLSHVLESRTGFINGAELILRSRDNFRIAKSFTTFLHSADTPLADQHQDAGVPQWRNL